MKTILFVAQDSFPLHGAESIVNLKLLTALSKSGEFTIDLISKRSKGESYGANSLEELGIKIRNLYSLEVDNKVSISSLVGHFRSLLQFGIVFKGSHWAVPALKIAKNLCETYEYDYVVTKNQASVLVGYYLKKHLGMKWVATWNDPFPSSLYPSIYADFIHEKDCWAYRKIIRETRKYVDAAIVPSERLKNYLLPYYKLDESKVVVIPHVVLQDEAFCNVDINRTGKSLRIIHSGNISYPRDPKPLLTGLAMLLRDHPDYRIKLDILGMADSSLKEQIASNNLGEVVQIIPPVSYIESLHLLKKYHAAVVVEAVLDEGIFLPTKVSDFMQCGKAICAISPIKGVLNDLYVNGNIGYFADNLAPVSVYDMLDRLYCDYKIGSIRNSRIPYEYTEQYVVNKYSGF